LNGHSLPGHSLDDDVDIIKNERRTVIWVPASSGSDRQILKLYRRRGIVNFLRCRITRFRVQREYDHLRHLVHWGIPCPAPQAWNQGFAPTHGFYELLATSLVEDCVNLETWLRQGKSCDLQPLFASVRRMHDSGCCHHALFSRNILISKDEVGNDRFAICDMARSRIFANSVVGTRLARLDIAGLVNDLVRLGVPQREIPYDAYDLSSAESSRLEKLINRYANNKLRRVVRDGESRIRSIVTHVINVVRRKRRVSTRLSRGPRTAIQSERGLGE
jgi:hypothetical protein